MTQHALNERSLAILKSLIEHYIRDGQPVGSKTLATDSALMVSSATIRNIMADLEAAGYLQSPHTSAGRIPTTQGFRLFVDNFITVQPLRDAQVSALRVELGSDRTAQSLVSKASNALSNITQLAGIVSLPMQEQLLFKQVEFLPLSEQRVLVILVVNNDQVQNRVIHTDRRYSRSELTRAANELNAHFAGLELRAMRDALFESLQQAHHDLESMLASVVKIAEEACHENEAQDYVLAGEANLFAALDESNYQQLQQLFAAFSRKRDILHLLDQSLQAKGIQIFIGEESGHQVFDDYSVVTAPYTRQGQVVGVLGVIGPTRMSYHQVISAVDITAKLLSQAFEMDLP